MMTDDLKMTLVESKELGKIILTVFLTDEHNILLGKVWGDVSGNRFQIAESFVYAAARGQGHGYAMYRRLIDEALGRGLEVYSDSIRTFEDGMVMTMNKGLTVRFKNGARFQLTIVQAEHPSNDDDEEDVRCMGCGEVLDGDGKCENIGCTCCAVCGEELDENGKCQSKTCPCGTQP